MSWNDIEWKDYYYLTDNVIDAAVLWKENSYIPNSLFVFHDYHYLVLYYREMEKIVAPISILKKESKKKKHTKKVRISSILPSRYGIAQNKTKKHGTRKEVL